VRIFMTVDPYIPVPPSGYGGIERVVDMLVRTLIQRGHDLTLLAHPDSRTPARLIPYGRPPHVGAIPRTTELAQAAAAIWRHRRADVIHSFGRLAALLPVLPLRDVIKVQSYQRDCIPWPSVARATALAGPSLAFTGLSSAMYGGKPAGGVGRWTTVPNGVETSKYTCRSSVAPDAPLMFLGRIEAIKGTHHAIAIARGAGRRLIIAGNRPAGADHARYFEQEIAPHIDGARVTYVGEVDDRQKDTWLGQSAALLMPIDWEEPFGIVMTEALACGTPVIAFRRGSVPDVIRDGVNGFSCATVAEAIEAVRRLPEIDRAAVRADCEARYDVDELVSQYERVYDETRKAARR
jgi:glycosyltransferase involved in cell wall biosynthesis